MPHVRCAACYERIEAGYPEALTLALSSHLEREHGMQVPLIELAPSVKSAMSDDGVTGLAVARIVCILIAVFFLLVALELGPGWVAISALAVVMVVMINAIETSGR